MKHNTCCKDVTITLFAKSTKIEILIKQKLEINHFWHLGDMALKCLKINSNPQKDTKKLTSVSHFTNTDWWAVSYFYLIGFIVFPQLEKPLKAVYNPAQKALTDHNNEFCEWTCLYAPLPRGWNMISREWKPFENLIFKRNTSSQRAAAWRHEALRATPDEETTCVSHSISWCIYLRLSECLSVCLSLILALYFLTVLISRETHEHQQTLWNLMDLEWTWELKKTSGYFKYFKINLVLF